MLTECFVSLSFSINLHLKNGGNNVQQSSTSSMKGKEDPRVTSKRQKNRIIYLFEEAFKCQKQYFQMSTVGNYGAVSFRCISSFSLRSLEICDYISAMFLKLYNFDNILFAFLYTNPFLKGFDI